MDIAIFAQHVSDAIDREAGAYYGDRAGVCDRVNGIFAAAAMLAGCESRVVIGHVDDEDTAHVWALVDGWHVDLAGAQFGLPAVHVFRRHPRYGVRRVVAPDDAPTDLYPEDLAIAQSCVA